MTEDVKLKIGSQVFQGWKSFQVSLSIESVANSFKLSVTDNWQGLSKPWPILPGDAAELLFSSDTVITGWVDETNPSADASSREIAVSGRSKAGDLVDCSADVPGASFYNITLFELAKKLCTPFGITVDTGDSTGAAFSVVQIQAGESPFSILEKRARQRGLLFVSTGTGSVKFMKPASTYSTTALEEGQNILKIDAKLSMKDRFSLYKVKAQNSLDESGTAGFQVQGKATDSIVNRYRPMVIQAETQADAGAALTRAKYEASVRAAKSCMCTVVVEGFRQRPGGQLWVPNQLVKVKAPQLAGIDEELLITDVAYSLDPSAGPQTSIGLTRKDAFNAAPTEPDPEKDLLQKLREAR